MLSNCALRPLRRCLPDTNHPTCFNYLPTCLLAFSRSLCIAHSMEAWTIDGYGSNDVLELSNVPLPKLQKSTDVLIRVRAASVNPIDYRMRSGYGQTLLNLWRKAEKVDEFPLILGRDFSGEVVKTGRLARRFEKGDEVEFFTQLTYLVTYEAARLLKYDDYEISSARRFNGETVKRLMFIKTPFILAVMLSSEV